MFVELVSFVFNSMNIPFVIADNIPDLIMVLVFPICLSVLYFFIKFIAKRA